MLSLLNLSSILSFRLMIAPCSTAAGPSGPVTHLYIDIEVLVLLACHIGVGAIVLLLRMGVLRYRSLQWA